MKRVPLGRTGLLVSRLAFGTGYLGGPVTAGARLLVEAFELGVNFWDTSDDYGTHPHVARAAREVGRRMWSSPPRRTRPRRWGPGAR
jgi:aryl-alcohol dehydrogenase-like predicted oxidoreductase